MARYSFGGDTGKTPEDARRQREIANMLMGRTAAPKNVGEGFNAMMSGLVGRWREDAANEAEAAGQASALSDRQMLASMITGGRGGMPSTGGAGGALAAANDMGGASVAEGRSLPPHIGPTGDTMAYRNAIASIESAGSGDYAAVGPTHPTLGRALGRYQVMEANIGPWSRQVLGREVSPDEFMANPELQDAIFDGIFGGYVNEYGPEGAAQAWFSGPGGVGKMGRRDVLGTTNQAYTDKFNAALGGGQNASAYAPTQVASLDPSIGMPPPVTNPATGFFDPGMNMPATVPDGAPQQAAAPQPAPGNVAQAPMQGNIPVAGPEIEMEALLQIMSNPWADESTKRAAMQVLDQRMAPPPGPDYGFMNVGGELVRTDGTSGSAESLGQFGAPDPQGFSTVTLQLPDGTQRTLNTADPAQAQAANDLLGQGAIEVKGSLVDIQFPGDQGANNFFSQLSGTERENYQTMLTNGHNAGRTLAQLDQLEGLLANTPQGFGAAATAFAGNFGIDLGNATGVQAAEALINQMVPAQRPPGSGPMSDADLELFKRSVPRLINRADGNALIIQTMRDINTYDRALADLIQEYTWRGEMAQTDEEAIAIRREMRGAISELQNPMENFNDRIEGYRRPEGDAPAPSTTPGQSQANPDILPAPEGVPADLWGVMTPEERALWQ